MMESEVEEFNDSGIKMDISAIEIDTEDSVVKEVDVGSDCKLEGESEVKRKDEANLSMILECFNKMNEKIDRRFDESEIKFDNLNKKFNENQIEINKKFEKCEVKNKENLDNFKMEINKNFEKCEIKNEERFNESKNEISNLNKKLDEKFDELRLENKHNFEKVIDKFDALGNRLDIIHKEFKDLKVNEEVKNDILQINKSVEDNCAVVDVDCKENKEGGFFENLKVMEGDVIGEKNSRPIKEFEINKYNGSLEGGSEIKVNGNLEWGGKNKIIIDGLIVNLKGKIFEYLIGLSKKYVETKYENKYLPSIFYECGVNDFVNGYFNVSVCDKDLEWQEGLDREDVYVHGVV